jgi:uncharacterized membrane protein
MSSAFILSIVMLAAIALTIGAVALWRRGGARLQVVLMLVLAAIMIGNVLLWVLPGDRGVSLADAERGAR